MPITKQFFLPMVPPTVTEQEHRIGRRRDGSPYVYRDARLGDARSKLLGALQAHVPDAPMDGALMLIVKWCFPRGRHIQGAYKTTRPDTDNLNKMLKDCMTELCYWHDDAQVACEVVEKFWSEPSGIFVRVEVLESAVNTID